MSSVTIPVITNRTPAAPSSDFVITRMITDRIDRIVTMDLIYFLKLVKMELKADGSD